MKKHFIGLLAVTVAIIGFAFTSPKKEKFTTYYFSVTSTTATTQSISNVTLAQTQPPTVDPNNCDGTPNNYCLIEFPGYYFDGTHYFPATVANGSSSDVIAPANYGNYSFQTKP
jgi:hypothetical protein